MLNSLKRSWSLACFSGKNQPLPSPSASSQSSPPYKNPGNVIKAPLDKKEYKVVELQNGLKVCLVSTCELKTTKDSVFSKLKPSLLMNSQSEQVLLEQEIETFNEKLKKNQNLAQTQNFPPDAPKSSTYLPSSMTKIPKLGKSSKGSSSVCVCVGAGSLHDPFHTNGLAHFVEQLILQGSKQFPEPNTLFTKVFQNGGTVNAATHLEYTNYFFQCNALAFEECVSILVDGLTNPLFNSAAVENAIQTIDSEYMSNQANDTNLIRNFLRSLVTKGHPLSKSCWGNKETLQKSTTITEARQFKERYYRANYMTVCIQAPMSIEELERFAVKHFSDIPTCLPSWNWKSPSEELLDSGVPYKQEDFHAAYFIAPVTLINSIMITWALSPKFWKNFTSKPLEYIRLLLESNSKGGLKHYLRKKQWISEWGNLSVNRCSSDDYYRNTYCSMFELTIILTDWGYEKKHEVVQAVFSYLKKIRREGIGLHRFEEMQMNTANKFHYQNWEEMLQSGVEIAVNMQRLNQATHLLTSVNLVTSFNPAPIDEALASMMPCTANFIVLSRKNSPHCKHKTSNNRLGHTKQEFNSDWYSFLEDTEIFNDFSWPEYKHFMPKEVCLRVGEAALNRIGSYRKDKKLNVEYLSDKKSIWVSPRVPSASILVHFSSPPARTTSKVKLAVLEYWTRLMCDRIVANAGHQFDHHFTFGVEVVDDGITLHVDGPRCHLVELLVLVVQEFFGKCGTNDEVDGGRVAAHNLKEDLLKELTNDMYDVENLSNDILSYIQHGGYQTQYEAKDQLKKLLLGSCYYQIILDFRREMLVNVQLQGCITTGDLNKIVMLLSGRSHNIVNCAPPRASISQDVGTGTMLPVGTRLIRLQSMHPAHVSSVTTNYYQMDGWKGPHARKYVTVLHSLLKRPLVKNLITKEQLGYNIHFVPFTGTPLGLSVTVLALPHKHCPYCVSAKIDLFFCQFYEQILKSNKTRALLKKRYFNEKEGVDKLIVGLENFYRDNLLKGGSNFRKLTIQLHGYRPETNGDIDCQKPLKFLGVKDEDKMQLEKDGVEIITNLVEFKNSLQKVN